MLDLKLFTSLQSNKVEELIALYSKVKSIIIQAEQETGNAILSCINEQRNSYDHFLRAINDTPKFDFELDKAKGHLYRAAYDANEILAIKKLEIIKSLIDQYDADLLNKTYPKFIAERYHEIATIEVKLIEARKRKTDFINNTSNFDQYEIAVNQLIAIEKEVVTFIPFISKQSKRENRKNLYYFLGGGFFIGIILLLLEYFIFPLFI